VTITVSTKIILRKLKNPPILVFLANLD